MQLIIGGAYSGKRKYVRDRYLNYHLISAYNHDSIDEALSINKPVVVLEGFEQWIQEELSRKGSKEIRDLFAGYLHELLKMEREENIQVYLLMLEIGRGIVPVEERDRKWRDITGWVQQDAQNLCESVYYSWHGLVKKMK
ncbi:bifunctional adenosylcobinamide kinase/adenosylcobinamide-phosphate guanylyltransferase [Peribacillus deserti]|uniref:bifunctional adenosylcobinamide kinase/adenosylcobinamide-phosphate guanylyltransferase n=1 Tax=Peribacillus deserti TaxID=673318 RepID=UPI0015E0B841|nr:bifunctional adenosylcobinamide kinase/adenosylcobinamide-phosphate guanylyltransferase [Peribacillus deserti]